MKTRFYRTPRGQWGRQGRGGGLFSSVGKLSAFVAAVVVAVLVLLRVFVPATFDAFVSPLRSAGDSFTQKVALFSTLSSRASLISDRDRLAAENAQLQDQNAVLTARVADLTRLLGDRTEPTPGILAGVLARPPVSPYDALLIDQGASSGVHEGANAYGPGGIPLGTVSTVDASTARVVLYTSPGNVIEGWAGEARIPVKLTGVGAGGFDAELTGNVTPQVGDAVYVPGPGALPIGIIAEVSTDPSSPTATLHVRTQVNPFSLTWLTIRP